MTTQLETLQERRKQIDAKIQAIRAREARANRGRDTRRKILIGSAALKLVEDGKIGMADLVEKLSARDRKLFDETPNAKTIAAMQETEFETVTLDQAAGIA
jgi:hypothetical protein